MQGVGLRRKHSRSVSCLSVKRLLDIDLEVLEKVVSEGFKVRAHEHAKNQDDVCQGSGFLRWFRSLWRYDACSFTPGCRVCIKDSVFVFGVVLQ